MAASTIALDRHPRSPPSLADLCRSLAPRVARGRGWWAGVAAAWLIGAGAGVAPTAFQGYPAPGLMASALWGLVGVALLAPLVITPMVATVVSDDDRHQIAYAWHGLGVSPTRRLLARTLAVAGVSLALPLVGAMAGLLAGVGLAVSGRDPLVFGCSGGPALATLVLGAGLLLLAWVIGGLLAAATVVASRALLVLVLSWLVTGAVASVTHFSPSLGVVFRTTPWAALWPFDPASSNSAQFAVSIPAASRLIGGAIWLGVLALAAWWRRRVTPYPVPAERRRRH
jgi:hypothetical protein